MPVKLLHNLRHGDHDQKSHGHGGYTETYGDVLDESSAGEDNEFVVAVTETSDMHLAYDPPGGKDVNDRRVVAELTPEDSRALADELDWAADYEITGNESATDDGVIDSTGVQGRDDLEVWVYSSGDVGVRNIDVEEGDEQGEGGFDLSSEDAAGLAGALREQADFYDERFSETRSARVRTEIGPGSLHPYPKLLRDLDYDELIAEAAVYLREQPRSPDGRFAHGHAVLHPDELVRSIAAEFLAGIPPLPRHLREQPRDEKGRFDFGTGGDEGEGFRGGAQREAALDQIPSVARSQEERAAVGDYRSPDWYQPMNNEARGDWERTQAKIAEEPAFLPRGVGSIDELRAGADERLATMDGLMERSQLTGDIETYRGVQNGSQMFGDSMQGDMTGLEWREDAFVSTSVRMETAREFADPSSRGVLMRMSVPEGTGAIEVSGMSGEAEILTERGLSMRVVADRGYEPDWGFRVLDVEVVKS